MEISVGDLLWAEHPSASQKKNLLVFVERELSGIPDAPWVRFGVRVLHPSGHISEDYIGATLPTGFVNLWGSLIRTKQSWKTRGRK